MLFQKSTSFPVKITELLPISFIVLLLFNFSLTVYSQTEKGEVYVDKKGVMRWENTEEELKGFGVNYTVPFAHAYKVAKRLDIDIKKAIDRDVYHFSRLGFDLYRVHVWDTEISDTLGNLLENEHLDLFDYLLKKLEEKGIKSVVTPIAFWGGGWPEPDQYTPGFSHKYGKGDCLTNPEAIKAQQNFLYQFINHVNPYTGKAYKNDPNIIAFEISNEPHHRESPEKVTEFIKGMVEAVRKTGTKKPIFYNASHSVHLADAYFKAGIQGGTFQWYPTGLGYQREIPGNVLPNVDKYNIPFDKTIQSYGGAKLVYEFDAADVGRSYAYPAMARSFRKAGIQIATHFSYDPTYMADVNTEYNTHYMNLAYTPSKALALMICSEIFHNIPMYADHGKYPDNSSFEGFQIDYHKDLATYNVPEKFIYTNHTKSQPIDEEKLEKIAGFGQSPIVEYTGKGAYFLDKIEAGVWRLEVMPDAVWVDNPFGRNSPDKTIGVIKWQEHEMKITLKNLGNDFIIEAINVGNDFKPEIKGGSFSIKPGTYMLSKKGTNKSWSAFSNWGNNKLNDFYAPESTVGKLWFKHLPLSETTADQDLKISVQAIAPEKIESIEVTGWGGSGGFGIELKETSAYQFEGVIPADKTPTGFLRYYIVTTLENGEKITYPAGLEGGPYEWDFYDRKPYFVKIVPQGNPIHLFNAEDDLDVLVRPWRRSFRQVPTKVKGESAYQMNLNPIFRKDNENLNAKPIHDFSFKHYVLEAIRGRKSDLESMKKLVLKGRSLNEKPCKIQIAFVLDDGGSYGSILELKPKTGEYTLDLANLKPVKTVTLPRPYPTFLPHYLDYLPEGGFDINKVESIQFSIGPGIPKGKINEAHGIGIISVRLE